MIKIPRAYEADKHAAEIWKRVYSQYRPTLAPNRRTTDELADYLKEKYPLREDLSERSCEAVAFNVLHNECYRSRMPEDAELEIHIFWVMDTGEGEKLYKQQEPEFRGGDIVIGMERQSGYAMAGGSFALMDEITVFMGLDEKELENYYLVANYVRCLDQFGILNILTLWEGDEANA